MLILSKLLLNRPILSLRTGGEIATATRPIVNPDNLKIEGFYCSDKFNGKTLILLSQDIRDIMPQGLAVNDHEVLVEPSELVRLQKILEINFSLIGKPVVTISKKKVGKVSDFATESPSLYIQKIYASQSLIKSFSGGSLSIDRSQIQEITNSRIIINDLEKDSRIPAEAPAPA